MHKTFGMLSTYKRTRIRALMHTHTHTPQAFTRTGMHTRAHGAGIHACTHTRRRHSHLVTSRASAVYAAESPERL